MTIPSRALIAAAAVFLGAATVFAGALVRALTPPPVTLASAPAPAGDEVPAVATELLDAASAEAVFAADPFQPDRQRPPQRYRLPGDVDSPPPPPPPPPPEIPHFRVAGTAVVGDGGFALMRIGDGPERILGLGEYLGGYQLHRIQPDVVVMRNDEREVSVLVPGPAPEVAAAPQPAGRNVPGPQRNAPNQGQQQGRQQLTPEQARRMVEMLERARADGATPQMLQAIQQLIQQRGIDSFQNMDIIIENGTMRMTQRRPPGGGREERN